MLLLVLTNPLTWDALAQPLWAPPAGLGLVLVAWFGWRIAAATLATSGLVLLAYRAVVCGLRGEPAGVLLTWTAADTVLTIVEATAAWWLYHRKARGNIHLADPRSAMQFVLLVAGVCAALAGGARLLVAGKLELPGTQAGSFSLQLALFWLDRALGVLIVAPPLLVLVTPWIKARGLLRHHRLPLPLRLPRSEMPTSSDPPNNYGSSSAEDFTAMRVGSPGLGDWLEIVGLAACASIFCLLLSRLHGRRELLGWQLWGVQILLIVWASLRQGLRGGTLTATTSALLTLAVQQLGSAPSEFLLQPLLQAHLAAQCSAALLVAAASSWVRLHETGYRQVVAHVPVVIYSARLLREQPLPTDPGRGIRPGSNPDHDPAENLAEITLVSAASLTLLGCHPDQLLGDFRRWLACVHGEDRVVVFAALEQLARQKVPVTCEYRLAGTVEPGSSRRSRGPDGSITDTTSGPSRTRWLRDTLAPHRTPDGRLVGWEGVVIDITEQRHLADDLRRTTSMFHALIANLPTGVFFIQGPHGNPILVNSRARQLLGTREDSAASLEYLPKVYRLYKQDGTLFPAEELPVYLALRQGRTTMRDDIVVHRPDGRRIPLVTWAAPVHLSQRAAPDCAVWVLEDLTALHQAEAARKDTEGRLRAVIETMAEGLFVHDARGTIVNSNTAAGSYFNRSSEDLRGQSLFDLGWRFVREDGTPLPRSEHPTEVALRTGRPVRHVVLGLHPESSAPMDLSASGTKRFLGRWLLVNAMPLGQGVGNALLDRGSPAEAEDRVPFTRLGSPAGVVTTCSDISAYVHARETIRVSEERYRGLVESLPLMLVQADQNLRLMYANPATTKITGYTLDEIREPIAWANVMHPDDLALAVEIGEAALKGRELRGEVRYRAKDGTEKVCFAMGQPRYQDGVIVGTTTLLLDITRERQLESELARARRLELVGRLSSGVAHDFNNLLNVVLNLTDLARGHLPSDHPVHADLKRISEAGEQAAGLAAQLLRFSKQKAAPARKLDLGQIVHRTLELLRATLPGNIQVEERLEPEPTSVMADETQLQQVLMNLCLNARDAMPQGGTLRVTLARESHPAEASTNGITAASRRVVRLCVADTGQGMSAELRDRIFEPFFSTKDGGTGLGLAVVQQIVESYGGTIDVSSAPGQGSHFDIQWPEA